MSLKPLTFTQVKSYLLSQIASVLYHGSTLQTTKIHEELYKHEIPLEEWKKLTVETAQLIGFAKWEEEENPLLLIPLWLVSFIPDGIQLTCIDGETFIVDTLTRARMDNDTRFGCLAYGIRVEPVAKEEKSE